MSDAASSCDARGRSLHGSHTALISRPVMPSLACAREEDRERGALLERGAAGFLLLQRALVEVLADHLGAGREDLVEHARVERAGRDAVDVDP